MSVCKQYTQHAPPLSSLTIACSFDRHEPIEILLNQNSNLLASVFDGSLEMANPSPQVLE